MIIFFLAPKSLYLLHLIPINIIGAFFVFPVSSFLYKYFFCNAVSPGSIAATALCVRPCITGCFHFIFPAASIVMLVEIPESQVAPVHFQNSNNL